MNLKNSFVAALCIVLFTTLCQGEVPQIQPLATGGIHTLHARAKDMYSGRQIADFTITVTWQTGKETGVIGSKSSQGSGAVSISGQTAVHWVITFSAPGYQTKTVTRFATDAMHPDNLNVPMRHL
jgi:hypothetical protein